MNMDKPNNSTRVKFTIDKTGFFAEGAMMLFVFAALFQVLSRWGQWGDRISLIMLLALPVASYLLMALCVLLFGKKCFFLSAFPTLMGVVFFIYKLIIGEGDWLHLILCILLYLAIVILYPATVIGWIRTKWLLPPLFAIPLAIHIARDLPRLSDTANPVTFSAGMHEMSMLCVMTALMFIGFGLKKHEPEPDVVEPEIVEPEPEPVPADKPEPVSEPVQAVEPAPVVKPEPEPVPAIKPEPAAEAAHTVEPEPAVESAAFEKPASDEKNILDFDPETAFEPAPAGSIPELTLDPDPIDFGADTDAQGSAHEQ